MIRARKTLVVFCLLLAAAAVPAQAAPIVYSAPKVGGMSHVNAFGEAFVVPVGNTILTSFGFYLETLGIPSAVSAYVYEWGGSTVTGSALFSDSAVVSVDGILTFAPNLALTAGTAYIAMFSWATGFQEGLGCLEINIDCPVNPSPSTSFFLTQDLTEAGWQTNAWGTHRFRVAFNIQLGETPDDEVVPVPEPAILSLVGFGFACAMRRRLSR